ncbi:MAG: diphthamide biosynthesis enzyme Dph2 [Candidatus Bathyarchaeota archaeon]
MNEMLFDFKIVLLQLPEGLKPEAPRLAKLVEEVGALPIVSADPCYGACDLAVSEAKNLGVDLIIHYGHSPMAINSDVPIVYFEAKTDINIKKVVMRALSFLEPWQKIGLVTTVQHIKKLEKIKDLLENAGKIVSIGDSGYLKYPGQVLGCDFRNALLISENVEAYLFIGGGKFHALGLALATGKPTIVADPYEQITYPIEEQTRRVIMQRWANILCAKKVKNFGILISLKTGQMKIKKALSMKSKLEKYKFQVTLFSIREVTPTALMQFSGIEAFVNTACPRLSLDDSIYFDKPILSINETLVMLGEMKWEDLLKKGWFENVI